MAPKRNGRNTKKSSARTTIPRNIPRIAMGNNQTFGFPNKLVTKLRYVDTYALVSTTGSIAKQLLVINSTFDPDSTGTGHQPLYRDTYAGIYNQYSVISCDITVIWSSNASTTALHVGCVVDDDTSTSATATVLMEQNNGFHKMLPPLSGSLSTCTHKYHWDCKEILSIDPFIDEEYKTPVGSNPSEGSNLLVWASPVDGISSTTTQVMVTLEQVVLFSELQTPSSS